MGFRDAEIRGEPACVWLSAGLLPHPASRSALRRDKPADLLQYLRMPSVTETKAAESTWHIWREFHVGLDWCS